MADVLAPRLDDVSRILVLHLRGGMGDVLVSTPVLDALRAAYPEARLDMWVREGAVAMVEHHPALTDVVPVPEGALDAPKSFLARLASVRRGRYDLGLVLWSKLPEALLLKAAGVRHRVGQDSRLLYSWMYTHRVPVRSEHGDETSHWSECQLDYARAVGADLADPRPRLHLSSQAREGAREVLGQRGLAPGDAYTVLHVGRGTPLDLERLPAEPFSRVANALVDTFSMPVVLTGGPGEVEVVRGVAAGMQSERRVVLAGMITVPQLGAVLEGARLVVANDSGPMHMAAAVGAPTVGIFAMEKDMPRRWGPVGPACAVARPASFACRPECTKETCPRMRCYEAMTPELVLEAAERVLAVPR